MIILYPFIAGIHSNSMICRFYLEEIQRKKIFFSMHFCAKDSTMLDIMPNLETIALQKMRELKISTILMCERALIRRNN